LLPRWPPCWSGRFAPATRKDVGGLGAEADLVRAAMVLAVSAGQMTTRRINPMNHLYRHRQWLTHSDRPPRCNSCQARPANRHVNERGVPRLTPRPMPAALAAKVERALAAEAARRRLPVS
jgi:hypothetical protein